MAPCRIVLADQQSLIRKGLIRIVEETDNCTVVGEADNSSSLVKLVRRLRPDLIIFDLNLPFIGGIDAFIECKSVWDGVHGLVLAPKGEVLQHTLSAGIHGYLLKDNADAELIGAIKEIENGNRYVSPSLPESLCDLLSMEEAGSKDAVAPDDILSIREKQVLRMIAAGMFNREIAAALHVSIRTVEHHRANIIRKLGVRRPADLFKFAVKLGYAVFCFSTYLTLGEAWEKGIVAATCFF
jgi:DNA-binding NarL/FixJ family response regulator